MRLILCTLLAYATFALAALPLLADDATDKAEQKPAVEPTPDAKVRKLFDGESLKNWKITNFGGEGPVEIKEGVLFLKQGEPLTGITWDGPALPKVNYEISFEAQRVEGSDFFCGLTFPVKENHCSLILGGWGGAVTGLSSLDGFDASENETTAYRSYKKGEWYKVRMRVTDKKMQAWLNDERIISVDYSNRRVGLRIEVEICKPLSFSTFATTGAYRNIELKELTPQDLEEQTSQNKQFDDLKLDTRRIVGYLDEIQITNAQQVVVLVYDETHKQQVYRIKTEGNRFKLPVFKADATYRVEITEPDKVRGRVLQGRTIVKDAPVLELNLVSLK